MALTILLASQSRIGHDSVCLRSTIGPISLAQRGMSGCATNLAGSAFDALLSGAPKSQSLGGRSIKPIDARGTPPIPRSERRLAPETSVCTKKKATNTTRRDGKNGRTTRSIGASKRLPLPLAALVLAMLRPSRRISSSGFTVYRLSNSPACVRSRAAVARYVEPARSNLLSTIVTTLAEFASCCVTPVIEELACWLTPTSDCKQPQIIYAGIR